MLVRFDSVPSFVIRIIDTGGKQFKYIGIIKDIKPFNFSIPICYLYKSQTDNCDDFIGLFDNKLNKSWISIATVTGYNKDIYNHFSCSRYHLVEKIRGFNDILSKLSA